MRSIHLIGKDTTDEWRLVEALGGPPPRFFQLSQRIAWGITQPDLIRVDLIDTARRLVASHGTAFPAHLLAAWVWRARDPERAERHLETARRLGTPAHPLAHLLPTDAEWRVVAPDAQALVEIVPGRIWRVAHHFPLLGAPLHSHSVATVIRTSAGDVAVINPVALDAPLARAIAALGPVRWVISQGKSHSTFVAPVRRQFEGALAIGTEGHLRHPPASHAMFDGVLGQSPLPDDFELLPIQGHLFEEVMILDRPSKTLIGQDVAAFADGGSFLNRLYTFAFGLLGGVGFPSFSLMLWQKLPAFHASLTRVRDAELTHVIGAHSPIVPRDGDAALLRRSIDAALAIGNLGHKAMLGRYFASQPGFLRDLVRYLKASKGKSGARLREATGSDA